MALEAAPFVVHAISARSAARLSSDGARRPEAPATRDKPDAACPQNRQMPSSSAISRTAFATLLLIALMMGANHVAARLAFDHGVDVATAVAVRSAVTAMVVAALLAVVQVSWRLQGREARAMALIGCLVAAQSYCLYSSVARLPVALALLAFNTYPLWTALWARLLYRHRAEARVLKAMPVLLVGLALALDVLGAASGLGARDQWSRIGIGVAFAVGAAAIFGLALVLTQHEAGRLDGRLRTALTMAIVAVLALALIAVQGGPRLPTAPAGWWGLAALTVLYGTAFTIMFTVLPRLGVVGHSAIMNVEPIFALVLAWALLGQTIAPLQVLGGLVVVATVVWLGTRRT
jgi:drug/metabolite transporter (DMT)-like permease